MNIPRRARRAAAASLTAAIVLIGRAVPLHAQDVAAAKAPGAVVEIAPVTALDAALAVTKEHGAATVAVFTAPDQPASARFWTELNEGAWARSNRGLVQFVNLSRDANAELVRTMGVTRFPTVVVYARGAVGVSRLGTITDCESADALTVWLKALDLGLGLVRAGQSDVSVMPTHFGGDVRPSQQIPPSPPSSPPTTQAPPQQQLQPQPQPQPQPTQMMLAAPPQISNTASLIQMPSQNLVIQQAPPQVFLATQAYAPQLMSAAPSMALAPALAPAPAPAANLFVTSPSVASAPAAPQPTMALAAAPQPTMALAAAPAQPALAVAATAGGPQTLTLNNQTLSLASTGTRSRVRVRGPGLLNSTLARVGERMTRLGRTRIESVQETTLEAPVAQAPPVGMTTISTTSAAPVIPQQPTMIVQAPEEVCRHKCKAPCFHRHHAPCRHEAESQNPPPQQAPPPAPPRLTPSPQNAP